MIRRVLSGLVGLLALVGLSGSVPVHVAKPTVLYFFRADCDACKLIQPQIGKLYEASKGRFQVIGIFLDKPVEAKYPTIPFWKWKDRAKYPPPEQVPAIYYVDRHGKVRGRGFGYFTADTMEGYIRPLVDN